MTSNSSTAKQASAKILLVEDDVKLGDYISRFLLRQGYDVTLVRDGLQALAVLRDDTFELVILDIMLPGMDGLSICDQIRDDFRGSILMFTAQDDQADEILGLDTGADDYLTKPVHPGILLARVRALLRRGPKTESAAARMTVGNLTIDLDARTIWVDGQEIGLTSGEFEVLEILAKHKGKVVSREEIFAAVRGFEYDGLDRSIDVRIGQLRKKIGDPGHAPKLIKSIRGQGYVLVDAK